MGVDSCLQFFRWFCCCFIVVFSVIGILIGILLTVLGIFFLWGRTVLSGAAQTFVGNSFLPANSSMSTLFGDNFNFESFVGGVADMVGVFSIVFIVIGLIIIIVSCVGTCGACCKLKPCLIIYSIIVLIFVIAEVVVVIMWFSNPILFKNSLKPSLEHQVSVYSGIRSADIPSLTLNILQISFGCCGVNNGSDFDLNPNWNRTYEYTDDTNQKQVVNVTYPISCCRFNMGTFQLENDYCPVNNTGSNYQVGCYNKILNQVEGVFQLNNIFFVLIGLAALKALLLTGAILIFCAARREEDKALDGREEGYKMQAMA